MVNDMSNYLKHIFRKALYLWPCLCVVLAASCMEEEQCDTCSKYPVKVQLNITAEEESSLNTRDTEVGKTHEYINTLCVLLVKDGKVVKKLLPDLSANASAKTGDLKNYVSAPFELVPGTYTVYAFANMYDTYLTEWPTISGLAEGADVSSVDFSSMVLTNPADTLDFSRYFIPMSAKQDVTVDASTRSISIGLDRLVSKIRIKVTPNTVGVNSLTFGGCADGVKLFADGTASSIAYGGKKTMNFANAESTLADFYVNATEEDNHPFSVELTTNEYNGTTYNATTKRGILPRNSIFPLTLQLNQYGLDLEAQCWVSPIGSLPVEVTVGFQNTYEVDVPEGCQFAFTVNSVKKTDGSGNVTNVRSVWTIPDGITGIAFDGATSGVKTVKGHITAAAGRDFELNAQVSWTDASVTDTVTYNRIYTIILHTKDLTEFPLPTTGKQNSSNRIQYLSPEMLNLFIK